MISQDRLEKAMHYLATTDEEAARLLADMERKEFRAKAVRDAKIVHGQGGLGERTAAAGCDPAYTEAMEEYFAAVLAFNAVKNKRLTEALVVDVWRSMSANRRQGSIT
jgi:hypothetical protein